MPTLLSELIRALTAEEFAAKWIARNTNRMPWMGHQVIHENEWPDLQERVAKFIETLE